MIYHNHESIRMNKKEAYELYKRAYRLYVKDSKNPVPESVFTVFCHKEYFRPYCEKAAEELRSQKVNRLVGTNKKRVVVLWRQKNATG